MSRCANRLHSNRGFSSGFFTIVLFFVLASAGAIWVSMGIVANERWPIRWLELKGSFHRVSADQLRSSLSPMVNGSFFTVDMQVLHETAKKNPWVASVSAQKQWPDTVIVLIEEHVPVAHWNSGQLISSRGQVFATNEADEIQGLPWLHGPDEQLEAVLDNWVRFNTMLESANLEIHELVLDQRGSWSLTLDKGTELHLGRHSANDRLERLMRSWTTLLYQHDLPPVRVDLRYTNGFAVHWPKNANDFAKVEM